MKIETKNYGKKNLLDIKPIKGTDGLFLGLISVIKYEHEYLLRGILDSNMNELIPFGELFGYLGTRLIDDKYAIVDYKPYIGNGYSCDDVYGSKLFEKENGEYKLLYNSDAAIIKTNERMLVGANFTTQPEDTDHLVVPTITYEYDYVNNSLVNRTLFDEYAYLDGRTHDYINVAINPYPEVAHRLERKIK